MSGSTKNTTPWRFAWLALCVLPIGLSWDFYRFLSTYHYYHERASAGIDQVAALATSNEILVVLTGDTGRIPRALELLKKRSEARLIVSGAAKGVQLADMVNQQGASTENLTRVWDKIILESESASTVENAIYTRTQIGRPLPERLILITSDYHMDRSLGIFRSVFPGVEIVPFCVSSDWSEKNALHFIWKLGAEYWKSLFFRLSLR